MGFSWMISHGDLPSRLALHPAHKAHFLEHCPTLPHSGADIGLLQEAAPTQPDLLQTLEVNRRMETDGAGRRRGWRTAGSSWKQSRC
jgi:hypothetical protein